MNIEIPATLTAVYDAYDDNYVEIKGPGRVVLSFGRAEVGSIPAIREPYQFYDALENRREEREVAEETVAAWLRGKLL